MAKRKAKEVTVEETPTVEVYVEQNEKAIEWVDAHLVIPAAAFFAMVMFMYYCNPVMFTHAYWQWIVDNTPHYSVHDLMPLDHWSDFWKAYK